MGIFPLAQLVECISSNPGVTHVVKSLNHNRVQEAWRSGHVDVSWENERIQVGRIVKGAALQCLY